MTEGRRRRKQSAEKRKKLIGVELKTERWSVSYISEWIRPNINVVNVSGSLKNDTSQSIGVTEKMQEMEVYGTPMDIWDGSEHRMVDGRESISQREGMSLHSHPSQSHHQKRRRRERSGGGGVEMRGEERRVKGMWSGGCSSECRMEIEREKRYSLLLSHRRRMRHGMDEEERV